MAACGMFEFSTRLFYTIYRPATSCKVLRYHLESCIVIPSYFTTTEWQNNWAFYAKRKHTAVVMHMMKTRNWSLETHSCGLNIDIAGIYNCVIRFIIAISDQTINYAIPRNLEKLYKSLVSSQLEYASQVWSPFTNLQCRKRSLYLIELELNLAWNCSLKTDLSYPERLVRLKLLPLEYRR